MTKKLKWVSVLLLICFSSCSYLPAASTTPPLQQRTPSPLPASADVFKVNTWLSDPEPARGEQVIAYGSLIKNGVLLGGIMMQGTWQDASHEPGTPNCFVLVTYGRGVCAIDTGAFPPGVYVPVEIEFDYRGATYSGSTGFTPR